MDYLKKRPGYEAPLSRVSDMEILSTLLSGSEVVNFYPEVDETENINAREDSGELFEIEF